MEKGFADLMASIEIEALANDKLVREASGEPTQRFCGCAELVISGKRLPCPRYHDCSYVAQRNKLIPAATRLANKRLTLTAEDDYTSAGIKFTRLFSIAMDELALPLLKQRNGDSPATDEQTVTEDYLGERVKREPMTVPLV